MMDDEIIKALECCISSGFDECLQCPLHNDFYPNMCHYERTKNVADLINRQKAEIKRLNNCCVGLQNERDAYKDIVNEAVDEAKSEAIKEFAERICRDKMANDPVVIAIKTELKLMEEKENEK